MSENQDIGNHKSLYNALNTQALDALQLRSYVAGDLNNRLGSSGVEVSLIFQAESRPDNWIPGVELIPRRIFRQRHRGHFGELARMNEGLVANIGLSPQQWASALMNAGTAKGFHIHPPCVEHGVHASDWFKRLFIDEPDNYALRPYDKEQWDLMFFVKGNVEVFLIDEREGLPRRKMRFIIDGDNCPGANNAALVIPPGVAHGLVVEGSEDLIMVYGTSTVFNPDFEGRIVSEVEKAELPEAWQKYF